MIKKVKNRKHISFVLVFLMIFSIGCKKKEVTTPPPVKKDSIVVNPMTPVQNQQSSAKLIVNVPAQTVSENVKDPFKPYVLETKPLSPVFGKGGAGRGLLPIQSYDVGQFRVLGIITGLKQNSALVADPTGKAYVVKSGMEIGKNGGVIEKISATTIEVTEKFRDENGKIKTRTVRLTLPRKE